MDNFRNEFWTYYDYCMDGEQYERHSFYKSSYLILANLIFEIDLNNQIVELLGDRKISLSKQDYRVSDNDEMDLVHKKSTIELKIETIKNYYLNHSSFFNKSDHMIKTVYWGDEFRNFVYFIEKKGLKEMKELFHFNFRMLYKIKGFNYISVNKIVNTFESWILTELDNQSARVSIDYYTEDKEENIKKLIEEFFLE